MAQSKPTLANRLQQFRNTARQLAKVTFIPTQRHLLSGIATPGQRLRNLGIITNLAILPFQVCTTPQVRQRIAIEVVRSQHRYTHKQALQAVQQQQKAPLQKIRLTGRNRWAQGIKELPPEQQPEQATVPPQTTTCHTRLPAQIHLQCPRCDHQVDGTNPPFRLDNLDYRTWCNQCRWQRFVRLWLCPCQAPWPSCPHSCTCA